MYEGFNYSKYLMRRKVLALIGRWSIYDPYNREVFYCCDEASSLKTDIRVYTNQSKQNEVLRANSRGFFEEIVEHIYDVGASYDILDPKTNTKIGAVEKGISWAKDKWIIMDMDDREIGSAREDSQILATIRRLVPELLIGLLFPKRHLLFIEGVRVGVLKKNRNPFIWETTLDFSQDIKNLLDRRMGIALALIMCAIGERLE